jgi:hypothetical protein
MRITRDNVVSFGLAMFAWALLAFIWLAVCLGIGVVARGAEPFVATIPIPVPEEYRQYKAICHIDVGWGSGSGTLIGTREDGAALVLSCRHVNQKVGQVVTVTWPLAGGQQSAGVVYEVIPGNGFDTDLALVVCQRPVAVDPVKVTGFDPTAGPFVAAGWRDNRLRVAVADVAALRSQALIWMPTPFIGGMSGGALFNRKGEQVAVVVASDRVTWGVSCDGPLLHVMIAKFRSEQ